MARILLLMQTSTYRASAFLEAARSLGVPVTVGSEREQALAAAHPQGHMALDFADPNRAVREISRFAGHTPFAAVLAADDDGVILAAAAAQALGLSHSPVAAVERARDKLAMRQRLEAAGVPGPWFTSVEPGEEPRRAARRVRYPCVLKPLLLSAGRGVLRADEGDGFVAAIERISAILAGEPATHRAILVEGFLSGPECSLEGLLTGGELRTLAIFDKPGAGAGPAFEETIYVTPTRLPSHVAANVHDCVQDVARALGLTTGPVHAQVRITDAGPRIVEIAPRSIGGLCSLALRFGNGVSLEELILRHALGEDVGGLRREEAASGVMMIPIPAAGTLEGFSGIEDARAVPGIEDVRITIPAGQVLIPLPEGARYLGFIFARGETPDAVEETLRSAHGRLRFEVRPAPSTRAPDTASAPPRLQRLQGIRA